MSNARSFTAQEASSVKSGFSQRLSLTINGQSISGFSMKCGVSESLLRKYLAGDSLPGTDKLVAIAHASDISLEWLATGDGPLQRGSVSVSDLEQRMLNEFSLPPWYNCQVGSDGRIRMEDGNDRDSVAFRKSWLENELGVNPKDLAMLTVRGDSMEPNIWDGDIVLIDTSVNQITDDAVYVLRRHRYLVVKRLQRTFDGGIKIKSDHSVYDDECVSHTDSKRIDIIGRVVWTGGNL